MYHRVEFDVWDPALQRVRRDFVVVDADGGDDAASQGRVKVLALFPGMGVKIIGIHPCDPPADAVEPEPEMDADGDGVVSKAELLAEAERRGIDVDKRWGVARLREALA
jgi:hypothetical protein